jgi:hypothetical protein
MISTEPNQSSNSPRSSIICSAPIATPRNRNPMASKRSETRRGDSLTNAMTPASASSPNGRLMKNTQRQSKFSVR